MQKKSEFLRRLKPNEYEILIDFCSNCPTHNNSLRHDQQKYLGKANDLKDLIITEFPFLSVTLRPLGNDRASLAKLGCFEVTIRSCSNSLLLFSKLKTLKWPVNSAVINTIRSQFQGTQVTVSLRPPTQLHPKNKLNNLKIVLKPMVEEYTRAQQPRAPSASLRRRIDSGLESIEDIKFMLSDHCMAVEKVFVSDFDDEFETERSSVEHFTLDFPNIKPGQWIASAVANDDVIESAAEFKIDFTLSDQAKVKIDLPLAC